MMENEKNNGKEEIGLATPTPGPVSFLVPADIWGQLMHIFKDVGCQVSNKLSQHWFR